MWTLKAEVAAESLSEPAVIDMSLGGREEEEIVWLPGGGKINNPRQCGKEIPWWSGVGLGTFSLNVETDRAVARKLKGT